MTVTRKRMDFADLSVGAGRLRPANGFNGRALPDSTATGGFTATNFFVSCLRRDGKLWVSGAAKDVSRVT